MKNLLRLSLFLTLAMGCNPKGSQQNEKSTMDKFYLFLVGTYTENPEDGMHLVRFIPEQGLLESLSIAAEVKNPSFVISNKKQNLVFAVEETGSEQGGKVTSFRFDPSTQALQKINSVFTHGDSPCHISLDPTERFLIISNYSGGNLAAIPVDQEGNLSDAVQVVQHQGSSINPDRQKEPHVHSAVFHPDESKIFVGDLGTDKIYAYDFDQDSSTPLTLVEDGGLAVEPGAGPRHLTFNAEGNRLYLIHEISGEIGVYSYENGHLSHLETHSLLPEGFQGEVGAAEVRISPDGDYLYASNRGEANDITVFQIEKGSGKLSEIQKVPSQGIAPRNFAITPDGEYVICGNQNSDKLVVFDRNRENGRLNPTDMTLTIKKPVYIYFFD